ncbi:MAG: PepSY domain-containing protein [Candidatus Woesearchaeota archaeon]|nr:PepSY domain-containing protein [Candidatus Woesearchaeota archaeon]
MTNTIGKIILGVIFVTLIGFNSFFILGQQTQVSPTSNYQPSPGKMNSYIPVREADDDNENEQDEDISLEQLQTINGRLTEEQAKAIALETIGGGSVIDFEAEREDGRLIYGVMIKTQGDTVEVEVDGLTGDVLEIEWGDDDKEEDDD